MTSTFRQAFLNISWWWQSSFGGGFSRAPSIPLWERFVWHSPMSTHTSIPSQIPTISLPKVETTSLTAWVDYQPNKFFDRSKTGDNVHATLASKYPWISSEILASIAEDATTSVIDTLKDDIKWRNNSVTYILDKIPTGTQWDDIEIHFINFKKESARDTIVFVKIKWLKLISSDLHDLEFENTNDKTISASWIMLALLAVWKPFISEEFNMSDRYRTIKMIINQTLKKYFVEIPDEPIILSGNQYISKIRLTAEKEVIWELSQYDIPTLFRTQDQY